MAYFRDNIERLEGYVPGYQPKSGNVIKLNTNENPYPPSPEVLKALAGLAPDRLRRYPDPVGNEFRSAAAEVHALTPENIICTNGGDDLLTICIRAFCDKTSPVACAGPTYSLYPVLAGIQDCDYIEIPYRRGNALPAEKLAKTSAGLIIVCNPNAPTASFIQPGEIDKLCAAVKGKTAVMIDEAYVDFADTNCIDLVKKHDNVIILRSMSKGYSLAGIRFGYGIACPELITGLIEKVKDSYNVDVCAITAATAAIKDQQYFKSNVEKVIAERKRLTSGLREVGFDLDESFTNFLFARPPKGRAVQLYHKLIERNIYVRYFDITGINDRLRITVGTPEQNTQLINAVKEILN